MSTHDDARRPAAPYGREAAYAAHPETDAPADRPVADPAPADGTTLADAPATPGASTQPQQPGAGHGSATPDHGYAAPGYPPPGQAGGYPPPGQSGYPPPGYPPPGQPGYPPPGYPPPGYAARPPLPRNDLAVWSLVLGLFGVLGCLFFTGVPAIVLGNNARRAVEAGQADNPGLATAGVVLGWVATALGALVVVLVVLSVFLPLLFVGAALPFLDVPVR